MDGKSVLTLYYGKDTDAAQARKINDRIGEFYPGLEIGVVDGSQPNYEYIISVE